MLLPVSCYLLQLATTRLRSVNYATCVLRFMVCMTVSVCSTVFRMETSCCLMKNVSSAMKREAEDSFKIFIETAVLQHWDVLGRVHRRYWRGVKLVTSSCTARVTLRCHLNWTQTLFFTEYVQCAKTRNCRIVHSHGYETAYSERKCVTEEALTGIKLMYRGQNTSPHF